jgi:hypothetical protein
MLGKLHILEVLDWYDGPRLFIAENASGNRYISFWADELDDGSLWLYVSVSESKIDTLLAAQIDLRQLYVEAEDGIIFKVFLRNEEGNTSVEPVAVMELEEELLPLSGDFLSSDDHSTENDQIPSSQNATSLTHKITINRPRSKTLVGFDALMSVAKAWSQLIEQFFTQPPIMVRAESGSLIVDLKTECDSRFSDFLTNLQSLMDSPNPSLIGSLNISVSGLLEDFLNFLHKERLTLTTEIIFSDTESSHITIRHSAVRELRLALAKHNQNFIESAEVPQADSLIQLFQMIDLIHAGEERLAYRLSLSLRQVNYYKQAARIMNLLDRNSFLTSQGKHLATLAPPNKCAFSRLLFESSPVGLAWLRYCQSNSLHEIDVETATGFLESYCPGLTGETIQRRARTLRSWIKTFQEHSY